MDVWIGEFRFLESQGIRAKDVTMDPTPLWILGICGTLIVLLFLITRIRPKKLCMKCGAKVHENVFRCQCGHTLFVRSQKERKQKVAKQISHVAKAPPAAAQQDGEEITVKPREAETSPPVGTLLRPPTQPSGPPGSRSGSGQSKSRT